MKKTCYLGVSVVGALLLGGCASSKTRSGSAGAIPGAKSRQAAYGTNKVHYLTVGKGRPTVVLVHCWAGNSGFWREQVPALADKARLILVDLPGHGQSDKPHADYTPDFFAGAVVAVLRDARVEKATLVGHSMGVPVICRVYAQAPEKVTALVAVDGVLRRSAFKPEEAEAWVAPFRGPDYREHVRRFVKSMFPNPGTEALCDRVVSEMLATPQDVMVGALEGMYGPGRPAWDLPKVNVPLLVLNAANPRWTAADEAYARSLSARTDYRTFEGVGHFLMLEKPGEFNATLTEMLGKFDLVGK